MTKEELKGTKIWFGDDTGLMTKMINKCKEFGIEHCCNKGKRGCLCVFPDFTYGIYEYTKEGYKSDDYKEITPSQLLGETEEYKTDYKVGDWVVYKGINGNRKESELFAEKIMSIHPMKNLAGEYNPILEKNGQVSPEWIRPARPEEIPQEEVEYWEMIENPGWNKESAIKGKIYPAGINPPFSIHPWAKVLESFRHCFKPSTREAYEAQQSKVNKCSTINTNQNECKNENSKRVITIGKVLETPRGERPRGSILPIGKRMYPSASRRK